MATTYEQLLETYQQSVAEQFAYKNRVDGALSAALVALRDYIAAPPEKCRFAPLAKDRKEGQTYGPRTAISYDKDGWWSGCYLLDVESGPLVGSELDITIRAFVDIDAVKFRIGDSDREHRCETIDAASLQPVIEEAVARSHEFFRTLLERFLGYKP